METAKRRHRQPKRRPDTSAEARHLNGWSLDEFNATVETVKKSPEAGALTWRSRITPGRHYRVRRAGIGDISSAARSCSRLRDRNRICSFVGCGG